MRLFTLLSDDIYEKAVVLREDIPSSQFFTDFFPCDLKRQATRCWLDIKSIGSIPEGKKIASVEINPESVFIFEGAFENTGDYRFSRQFRKSFVTGLHYNFGTFISPVAFATEELKSSDFYPENSGFTGFITSQEEYYIDCISTELKEKYKEFSLFAVRSCFESLVASGKMTKTDIGNYVVYTDADGVSHPICKHFTK